MKLCCLGRLGIGFSFFAVAASAGCSFTDMDGLTGGPLKDAKDSGPHEWGAHDAASTFDGSSEASRDDASADDASPDEDATPPPPPDGDDAAIDAPPDVPDASTDAGIVFQDDFEGAQSLPRAWDDRYLLNGALSLDKTTFKSSSTGLNSSTQSIAVGGSAAAVLHKRFAIPLMGETAVYEINAFVKSPDTHNGADAVIAALQLLSGAGDTYELQIDTKLTATGSMNVLFGEYTSLANGTTAFAGHATVSDLRLASWNKIRIELGHSTQYVARVYFDDVLQVQTTVTVAFTPSQVQLSAGLSFVRPPSDGWSVSYDDVVYSAR